MLLSEILLQKKTNITFGFVVQTVDINKNNVKVTNTVIVSD
jgi:hypothetical protein